LGEHKVRPYGHSPSIRLSRLLFSRLLSPFLPSPVSFSPVSFLFHLFVPVWANTRFAPTDIHLPFAFPVSFSPVSFLFLRPANCALRTFFFFTLSHTSSSCCAGSPG
jgi:hypothetical protein